jgi:hypothetical protein
MPSGKRESRVEPMGSVLADNLARLGYAHRVINTTEVAKVVMAKTGRKMTRQRIAQLINAVHISDDMIEALAKGLGVKPKDLTTPLDRKGSK